MKIDIARHISDLLYNNDSVIIPELGGIVATYQHATFDHVQGLLHPPSKKLSFNENLQLNNGHLAEYIKQQNNISLKESVDAVSDFVQLTKAKLNNKEILILPQIGRLYKDYENNLRFLQDATNFNTEGFGLPTLQFYPILRSQEPPIAKKNKPVQLVSDKQRFRIRKSLSKKIASVFLPLFLGLVVVMATVSFFKKQQKVKLDDSAVQRLPVLENRLNIKPSVDNLSFYDGISVNGQDANGFIEEAEIQNESSEVPERPTFPDQQKECVIIIGAYSKKAGVEKRVKDIYNFGYDAFQDKKGSLTRVGVRFGYEEEKEIKNMLILIREKFDSRAWVLEE